MNMSLSTSVFSPTQSAAREPTQREAAAGARSDQRLKESRAALETLKRIATPKARSDERKAAALKKVAQLKEQIRSLQMTATIDPKGTSRLAARLARELARAVKAYASAGGSAADLGPTTTSAPVAQGQSTENAVATEAAVEEPPIQADGPLAAPPVTVPSTASAATDAGKERREDDGAATGKDDEAGKGSPHEPYRQAIAAIEARGVEQALRAGEARGNAEFVAEVKRLAAELKSIIRGAARQLEARGDPASKAQGEEAEKALKDLDREIAEAERGLQASAAVGAGVAAVAGVGVSLLI